MKLRIHPLFLLLLVVSGWVGAGRFFFLSFVSVLLHELAHAVVAWSFSYRTRRIELYPFGGVALLDAALSGDAAAEGITAAAGPLHSLSLALLAKACGGWLGGGDVWTELARINFGLAFFNLLPFYPLDGGRMLRSVLMTGLGLRKAGRITAGLTRWAAGILLLPAALLAGKGTVPWIIPALFALLFWAAREPGDFFYLRWRQGEKRRWKLKEGETLPVAWSVVSRDTPLGDAGGALEGGAYHILLTADDRGRVVGWLDEASLWERLMNGGYAEDVGGLARPAADSSERGVEPLTVEKEENAIPGISCPRRTDNKLSRAGKRKEMPVERTVH